jgi:transcriptional regulator with PAS, ATPase and Fis domain
LSAGAVINGAVGSFAGAEAGNLLADEINEKI